MTARLFAQRCAVIAVLVLAQARWAPVVKASGAKPN